MTKRRRSSSASSGGLGLLIIAVLIGGFLLLRVDPALAAKLPPQVRTLVDSVPLPTSIPNIQVPAIGAPAAGPASFGKQTKTSGCQASGGLPDSACTPGDPLPNVSLAELCKPGYASSVRDVAEATKNQVYAEYGITSHKTGEYEVDHLISLELGGSNDISNLWPEAASPAPGFHEKDKVENYLHDQVCSGAISLAQAQQEIATNWLAVYNQMPH